MENVPISDLIKDVRSCLEDMEEEKENICVCFDVGGFIKNVEYLLKQLEK